MQAAIEELLKDVDRETVTLRKFRRQVASHLGLGRKGLESKADAVNALIKEAIAQQSQTAETASERMGKVIEALGEENTKAKQIIYLATLSHVLPETLAATDLKEISGMTRDEVAGCVRAAFDDPLPPEAGQPGRKRRRTEPIVDKLVVFREHHEDGEVHFHIAIRLCGEYSWGPAKRTLRARDGLACHFSCSHTQFWSSVRYGFIATLKKPSVDQTPFIWCADGTWPIGLATQGTKGWSCLFEASQRPWNAAVWKARSEQAQKAQAEHPTLKARFSKLDLTAIILDSGLKTKPAILEYAQEHGTEAMQLWVHNNQKRLTEFLADAVEWGEAREMAKADRETDWALICRTAGGTCRHGDACPYAKMAAQFFEANSDTLSRTRLAMALRGVILGGPSKTRLTPMILGPSNTGKSTLVAPFDEVFGKKRVFHKPALKSNYALRNILNNKRFLFWDDYRPVQYAQATVEVSTVLSLFNGHPFEVQVSQSFNDGNPDFEWRRGAVVTAPDEGLWEPWGGVTAEDVRHMRNRFEPFRCHSIVRKLTDGDACAAHMCQWIVNGAAEGDAQAVVQTPPVLPVVGSSDADGGDGVAGLLGMAELVRNAKVPVAKAAALAAELVMLGAVHVQELTQDDWKGLTAWAGLLPLEQRRLLAQVSTQ